MLMLMLMLMLTLTLTRTRTLTLTLIRSLGLGPHLGIRLGLNLNLSLSLTRRTSMCIMTIRVTERGTFNLTPALTLALNLIHPPAHPRLMFQGEQANTNVNDGLSTTAGSGHRGGRGRG